MQRAFLIPLFCFALIGPANAIDLTPRFITTFADGAAINRPFFVDGEKKYAITIDGETEVVASEGGALFTFAKFPSASMRLRQSPLKADFAFDETYLPRYLEAAQRLIPGGAKTILVDRSEADVLRINQWTSYRYTFAYDIGERRARQSVTFLNIDSKQQIIVEIKSDEADFDKISARGWDIIRRWHELKADAAKGN